MFWGQFFVLLLLPRRISLLILLYRLTIFRINLVKETFSNKKQLKKNWKKFFRNVSLKIDWFSGRWDRFKPSLFLDPALRQFYFFPLTSLIWTQVIKKGASSLQVRASGEKSKTMSYISILLYIKKKRKPVEIQKKVPSSNVNYSHELCEITSWEARTMTEASNASPGGTKITTFVQLNKVDCVPKDAGMKHLDEEPLEIENTKSKGWWQILWWARYSESKERGRASERELTWQWAPKNPNSSFICHITWTPKQKEQLLELLFKNLFFGIILTKKPTKRSFDFFLEFRKIFPDLVKLFSQKGLMRLPGCNDEKIQSKKFIESAN